MSKLPPLSDVRLTTAKRAAAGAIRQINSGGKSLKAGVGNATDSFIENNGDSSGIVGSIARSAKDAIAFARREELIERANLQKLPKLLDQEDDDLLFKADIIRELNSRLGASAPFVEELEQLAKSCFDRNVPEDRAIAFFESEEVLTILVDKILKLDYSRFRTENPVAIISSILIAVREKLYFSAEEDSKKPISPEIEDEIKEYIEYFGKTYNPYDIPHTLCNFIQRLKDKYGKEYRLMQWLAEHGKLLTDILKKHVPHVIRSVYQQRGRQKPEDFLNLRLKQEKNKIIAIEGKNLVIYENELLKFFNEVLPKISNNKLELAQLRDKFIECLLDVIEQGGEQVTNILLLKNAEGSANNGMIERKEFRPLKTKQALKGYVQNYLHEALQFFPSLIDLTDLCLHPESTPAEIVQYRKKWFDEDGQLNEDAYMQDVFRFFGIIFPDKMAEAKTHMEKQFQKVNDYLDAISQHAGIPSIATSEEVRNTNDLAKLALIACDSDSPRERLEARRKIEIVSLINHCDHKAERVFMDNQRQEIRKYIEGQKNGLNVSRKEKVEVRFIDSPDGKPVLVEGERQDHEVENPPQLIQATLAGLECYLLVTDIKNGGTPESDEYIGQKELESTITKLIIEGATFDEEVTDTLRCTIIPKSIQNLIEIIAHLQKNSTILGRILKFENRGFRDVHIQNMNVGDNQHKSDDYRTIRIVTEVPVRDSSGNKSYSAIVEYRLYLKEDLIKDRSRYHHAGHRNYNQRRSREAVEKLAPPLQYPEYYKRIVDKNNIFGNTTLALKSREDFAHTA